MKVYNVVVTPSAKGDLDGVFSAETPAVVLQLYEGMKALASVPFRHPVVRDEHWAKVGFRMFVVDGFRVYYLIDGDRVVVCRVLKFD